MRLPEFQFVQARNATGRVPRQRNILIPGRRQKDRFVYLKGTRCEIMPCPFLRGRVSELVKPPSFTGFFQSKHGLVHA
jgi:hypothetical protein